MNRKYSEKDEFNQSCLAEDPLASPTGSAGADFNVHLDYHGPANNEPPHWALLLSRTKENQPLARKPASVSDSARPFVMGLSARSAPDGASSSKLGRKEPVNIFG